MQLRNYVIIKRKTERSHVISWREKQFGEKKKSLLKLGLKLKGIRKLTNRFYIPWQTASA